MSEIYLDGTIKEEVSAIRKIGSYRINRMEIPNFVLRFNDNWERIEGYFSIIGELFIRLYGKLECIGYQIPNKAFNGKEIRPDVSVGRIFSDYLKKTTPTLLGNLKCIAIPSLRL